MIENGPFMGFETDYGASEAMSVAPGLGLSANPGLGLYKAVIESYEGDHFVNLDGSYNLTTIVTRTTNLLLKRGMENKPGVQHVDGVTIYPAEYFNPKDFRTGEITLTENTRTIHHFGMSWYSDADRYRHELEKRLAKRFPRGKLAHRCAVAAAAVRYGDFSVIKGFLKRHGA